MLSLGEDQVFFCLPVYEVNNADEQIMLDRQTHVRHSTPTDCMSCIHVEIHQLVSRIYCVYNRKSIVSRIITFVL